MIVAFVLGLGLGAALLYWYNKVSSEKRQHIPKHWPLKARALVNNREKQVWVWLGKVMFDHQLLVKLPVTRFTAPTAQREAAHWYHFLNGVYCTFTVCTMEGQVIGCVDVPGPNGLSLSNQTLKHTLLSQSGIHYWVVDPDNLPHLLQIRTAFLGEHGARSGEQEKLESRIKDVRQNLHATVDRQRQSKSNSYAQLDATIANTSLYPESQLTPGWEQNSFITPLDSRSGELGK